MVKVTVINRYLNVRVGKPLLSAPSFQYLAPGSEIEVDGKLYAGSSFENNDQWLKDGANNYYWSGGVSNPAAAPSSINGKTTFGWFKQLNVANIWQTYHTQGGNVRVAVLDTGYDQTNDDLYKITTTNSKVIIDDSQYAPDLQIIEDQSNSYHGTRCASLIGASNDLQWIVGIAPACELLIAKTSVDLEMKDIEYIYQGVKWALSLNAEVISVSYAVTLPAAQISNLDQRLQTLIGDRNVLLFAAAGNSGTPQQTQDLYPACFSNFISVGACNSSGAMSSITILNAKTIIHAPGEQIESFGPDGTPTRDSGTSFSTPIIAGIAALAISYLKARDGSWNKTSLLNKIYSSGDPLSTSSVKKVINPNNLFQNL